MLGKKHAFSAFYVCEVMHAMSTSNISIEYYKQQYCTLFIDRLTADVTVSQGQGVKLVEFSIAHISCSVSCIELRLGTNDEEGITQQIIKLCIAMLGIVKQGTDIHGEINLGLFARVSLSTMRRSDIDLYAIIDGSIFLFFWQLPGSSQQRLDVGRLLSYLRRTVLENMV